jgi:hypothetical protein
LHKRHHGKSHPVDEYGVAARSTNTSDEVAILPSTGPSPAMISRA